MSSEFQDVLNKFNAGRQQNAGVVMDPAQGDAYMARDLNLVSEAGQAKRLEAEKPIESFSQRVGEDGKPLFDIKGLNETAMSQLQELIQLGQTTKQQITEFQSRLQAKRDVMEKHPVLTQIGRVAAAAANAYQAPLSRGAALVHGAGAVASEYFKDDPLSLSREIADAEGAKIRATAPVQAAISNEQRNQELRQREERLQNALDIREERNRKAELQGSMSQLLTSANNGTEYPPGSTFQAAKARGANDAEAKAYEDQVQAAAAGYRVRKDKDAQDTLDRQKAENKDRAFWQVYVFDHMEAARAKRESTDASRNAALGAMQGIVEKHGKLLEEKNSGVSELNSWVETMRAVGADGWGGTLGTQQASRMLQRAFATNTIKIGGKETPLLETLRDKFDQSMDLKAFNAAKQKIESSTKSINLYYQQAPQLKQSYESRKKTLPKADQENLPSLYPGEYVPKNPAANLPPTPKPSAEAAPPATPTPAPTPSGPPPPNPKFTVNRGPAPPGAKDGTYDLKGSRVLIVNGTIWGQ